MSQAIRLAAEYDAEKANLLLPVTTLKQQLGPWHELRVTEVRVNPDPSAGEIYKVGSVEKKGEDGKPRWYDVYALGRPALDKIASAAGIVWDFRGSCVEFMSDRKVVYKMIGAVRLPDGTWQPIVGRKMIDLDVVEEEVRERQAKAGEQKAEEYRETGGKRGINPDVVDQWVEQQVRKEMLQWRKSLLQRAETGARLRCIRALLAVKSHYTRQELERPFVVPRIDFSPDYSDPEVRRIVLQHGLDAAARLFGPPQYPALTPPLHVGSSPQPEPIGPVVGIPPRPEPVRPAIAAPLDDEEPTEPEAEPFVEPEAAPAQEPEVSQSATNSAQAPAPSAAESGPQPARNGAPVGEQHTCFGCGKAVSDKVREYSLKRYGQVLCYDCQAEARRPSLRSTRGGGGA